MTSQIQNLRLRIDHQAEELANLIKSIDESKDALHDMIAELNELAQQQKAAGNGSNFQMLTNVADDLAEDADDMETTQDSLENTCQVLMNLSADIEADEEEAG